MFKKPDGRFELTEEQKDNRIEYCQEMLQHGAEMIYNTVFSDEMGITLSKTNKKKMWVKKGKSTKKEPPVEDVKLNCWGGICFNGATSLHIFKENLNKDLYEEIIEEHKGEMDDLFPDGYHFQHDNLKLHIAAERRGEELGLEFVDFPTYSPDLNPIENLWSDLKGGVASDHPRTEQQLIRSLKKNWERLTTVEALEPYFEGLERRYLTCIREDGERLPY